MNRRQLLQAGTAGLALSCLRGMRGYNIGGDYHFKRLLMLDWPTGDVEVHVFGSP